MTSHHEGEIEGLPLSRPFTARREGSPEAIRVIELHRRVQQQTEETEQLRYLAYQDNLTGLSNERAFSETFEEAVSAAITRGEKIGLVLADIDGLKFTNDTHGHPIGNKLLKETARALKDQSRPQDEVFRIGGDEFAIILPDYGCDEEHDQVRLDEETGDRYRSAARKAIDQLKLPVSHVDLSIGISAVDPHESPRDFFRRVDNLLYSNKPRKDDPRLRPIS